MLFYLFFNFFKNFIAIIIFFLAIYILFFEANSNFKIILIIQIHFNLNSL